MHQLFRRVARLSLFLFWAGAGPVACDTLVAFVAADHVVDVYVEGFGYDQLQTLTWDITGSGCYLVGVEVRLPGAPIRPCSFTIKDAGGGGSYTLFASAKPGFHLSRWGGDCARAAPSQPCSVTWNTGDHRDSVTLMVELPFLLTAPAPVVAVEGVVATVTVRVTRAPGFSQPISLQVAGAFQPTVSAATHPSSGVDEWTVSISPSQATSVPAHFTVTADGGGQSQSYDVAVTVLPQPADFSMGVTPNALTVTRGTSVSTTVSLNRVTSRIGSVQLRERGNPAGVSVTYSSNPAAGATSNMTVAVAPTVAAGTYTFDIEGTFSTITRSTSLTLTVEDPDYQLSAAPDRLTIPRGGASNLALNINRLSPMIQAVNLSAQNEPAGIRASFATNPEPKNASDVTVSVATTVAAGTYTFQLLGEALGIRRSVDVTVIVTDPTVSIALGPSSLTLQAGGPPDQTLVRVIGLGGGYNQQSATVTLPKLPSGVSATVAASPNILGAVIITLTAGPGASPGTFITPVHVVVAGVTYIIPLSLTIQAPLSDFQILQPSTPITVRRGAATSLHYLSILRHAGFTNVPITFAATGLPAGQAVTLFSPTTIAGDVATLTIYVPPSVRVATYTLTVTGQANGITRTTTMPVTVVP